MRRSTSLYSQGNSIAAGIRAAVLVVVLVMFAAAVDHVTARPHETLLPTSAVTTSTATPVNNESFVVPVELRANEGDVTPSAATF